MRLLLCCIPFFPSWMLKFIHQNPSHGQESLLPESIDCVLPLESEWPWLKKFPVLTTSVSCGAIGHVSHQWFPQGSQGHWGAWLLKVSVPWFGPCAVWCSDLLPKMYFNSIVMEIWVYIALGAFKNNTVVASFLIFVFVFCFSFSEKRILSWWSYWYSCFSFIKKSLMSFLRDWY